MPRPTSSNRNARPATPVSAAVSTPVRNSAIPKAAAKPARTITNDMIAKRAYEISQSPLCGSEVDNWLKAEAELRSR